MSNTVSPAKRDSPTVYYLKYRPQSLDDLVGQQSVKQIILGAFRGNRLSHAYLFVGPKGTGKTSTARILAKMVNCSAEQNKVPCNKCTQCISITDGSNLDLMEIDAASNRGIEDIRTLREKIKLAPTSSKKKVYIIDEVHMLTTEAFNALLKTLEEPPKHALFILATTEAQKLPQTILSRVQRLDFKPGSNEELLATLQKIVTMEKIDIDEEALKFLVKKSEGSFRDGIKFLDQVNSLGGKITVSLLQKSLQAGDFEVIYRLIKSFAKKDATEGLSLILKQVDEGVDTKQLMLSLMDSLRNLVFIKNELGEVLVKPSLIEEKYEQLLKLAESFTNQELIRDLDILQKALEKLKFASILSLPLELAVVEICGEKSSDKEEPIKEKLDDRSLKIENEIGSSKLDNLTSNLQPPDPASNIQHLTSNNDIQKLKEKWDFVLETIRPFNFSLEALLRSTNIKECTDTSIIMEVPYSFHQRILEAPKNKDLLESILSDILGRSIQLSTVLGSRNQRAEDVANIEVAADDEIIRVASEIFNSDTIN